jgi:hypothetical protein
LEHLLRIERQDERDDHNTLMLYRVMYDTGAMTAGGDYIEMSQLLGDAALPGEAQVVLEKAMSRFLMPMQQKERTNRLLNSFKTRAEADKKGQAHWMPRQPRIRRVSSTSSWAKSITAPAIIRTP